MKLKWLYIESLPSQFSFNATTSLGATVPLFWMSASDQATFLSRFYYPFTPSSSFELTPKTYVDSGLATKQNSLGYTAENAANKDIDGTFAANSDTKYPSQKATKTYVDTGLVLKADLSGGNNFSGLQTAVDGIVAGASSLSASAILEIVSTTKGFLMPRMTRAQREAIASPAQGLKVYDTTLNTECVYSGSSWLFTYNLLTTAIQASTSTTYAAITELTSVSLPAGTYIFETQAICRSSATTEGIGLRLGAGTATIGAVSIQWLISQAANGTAQCFQYNQLATATNITSASAVAANQDYPVTGRGVFTITAAGTVALQIRAETGASVSIRPNSILTLRKIA